MSGFYGSRANMIEGIGNEILYGLAGFMGILIPVIYYVWKRQNMLNEIHPDSASNVEATRAHLNMTTGGSSRHIRRQTQATRDYNNQFTCPICLGDAEFASETNCGHVFCGNCIIAYWQHGHWIGGIRCPVCRQPVNILLFNFTHEENRNNSPEKSQIMRIIGQFNSRFSGEPRSFLDMVRDLPTLLRHAFTEFFTVNGLLFMFRIRVAMCCCAAVLYFFTPFDIIPESMFGVLGFLDDIFIILLLAIYVTLIYRRVVENRSSANNVQ